jgi:hypothetical protein
VDDFDGVHVWIMSVASYQFPVTSQTLKLHLLTTGNCKLT